MIKEAGGDADLEEMAKQELKDAKAEKEEYEEKLKILLLQKIQTMTRTLSFEIRGAAWGDEAQLFAGDPYKCTKKIRGKPRLALWSYGSFLQWRWWDQRSRSHGFWSIGLFKTQVWIWCPPGTTRFLCESQGRVHTSTATVLVMPEIGRSRVWHWSKDLQLTSTTHLVRVDRNVNKVAQPFESSTCQPISR